MKKGKIKSRWANLRNSFKLMNQKLNEYDISKYILNLSYYQYTKKFGTNQLEIIKKILWIPIILDPLFFSAMVIQAVCCIVFLHFNNLYAIGIFLCAIWGIMLVLTFPFCFYVKAKKYYKVIDFLMGNGSLNPVAVNYPKVIYTCLWYFHVKPMFRFQYQGVKGLVIQSWYGQTKSLAIFIDRLNQYYLDHQNDESKQLINNPQAPNAPTN